MTDVNDELPVFNKASVTVPVPEDVGTDTPLPGLSLEVSSTTNNKGSQTVLYSTGFTLSYCEEDHKKERMSYLLIK